jgi:hypothetical protein
MVTVFRLAQVVEGEVIVEAAMLVVVAEELL